jgi:hypothetical protein
MMSQPPAPEPRSQGSLSYSGAPRTAAPAREGGLPLGPDGRPMTRRSGPPPPGWSEQRRFARPPIPDSPAPAPTQRQTPWAALRQFPRDHRLFCSVLAFATLVRIVIMLGYPPALWYPDSLPYVQAALHPFPYVIRPVGYSFLLILLEPLHSVLTVTALQHVMGLIIGIAAYVLLRSRFGLSSWTATLAAVPALLSAYEIQIEHFVLSDTFFGVLVTLAVVLVMWRPVPKVWTCAIAGLLLSWAALARSQGLLLAVPFVLYLAAQLTRRDLRRRVIGGIFALGVALAMPLALYAVWFDHDNGSFELTTSTGAFLYSRVAGFADCSVIKPPADERWLCLSAPPGKRPFEGYYVWGSGSPLLHGPAPEFSAKVNSLATDFAIRAVEAQPLDYLKAVWHSTAETFTVRRDPTPAGQSQSLYLFPASVPQSLQALATANYEDYQYGYSYNGNVNPSTRVVQPFAAIIRGYQRYFVVPGPLLGLIVLLGGVGVAVAWRRFGGPALLPWLSGVVLIVTPAATADFDARYVVSAVPVFCISAAIAVAEIQRARTKFNEIADAGDPELAHEYGE